MEFGFNVAVAQHNLPLLKTLLQNGHPVNNHTLEHAGQHFDPDIFSELLHHAQPLAPVLHFEWCVQHNYVNILTFYLEKDIINKNNLLETLCPNFYSQMFFKAWQLGHNDIVLLLESKVNPTDILEMASIHNDAELLLRFWDAPGADPRQALRNLEHSVMFIERDIMLLREHLLRQDLNASLPERPALVRKM